MTGQERRQQLLDIGRRLFAERGFEGTSIEEIAAQAGVSKPVVYEHFGGKEGLYAVVVDREVERLSSMTTVLFEAPHSRPKFEAATVSLLKYIEDNADGFRILVRDSSPGAEGGTYGTLLADIAGQVEYIMADFLKSRGRDPKLAPMYSQMMVGMVAFTGQWWLDARKPKVEQVASNLIDLVAQFARPSPHGASLSLDVKMSANPGLTARRAAVLSPRGTAAAWDPAGTARSRPRSPGARRPLPGPACARPATTGR